MKKTIILTMAFALFIFFSSFALESLAWRPPPKPGGGLALYVKKHNYQVGETVKFMLYKHAGVDDTPANLEGSYYVISKKKDNNKWREFYTSRKNPFGTTLNLETPLVWTWDQKDNERTHRAKPGEWRLRFFAPKGNISEPLKVKFTIR
ncbi:MAG: hypothetical protein DRG20_06055 [Deltaproteobacteria bacterium]|nr:hypothetical protein [Deltaproteobacteria bacterium]RLA88468.1 MAG: hypothetical protein DRG20_06055 [Deltaproteobacteria bacterium]